MNATSEQMGGAFTARFWQRIQKQSGEGCWEWTAALFPGGYGKVALPRSRKLEGAHRMAWMLVNGPIPGGLWVLHRCDNRRCCRPDHLFLGTPLDNMRDASRKGRLRQPPQVRRLSDEQVAVVRSRAQSGESHRSIAKDLNIDRRKIDRIIRGEMYRVN